MGYWVSTGLVAMMLLPAGVGQVTLQNAQGFVRLGYPVYFMVLLGVWKLVGGVVLLVPRLPRVKEWAYAGVFIDFSSAAISDAVRGGSVGHVIAPIVCTAILFVSWALRPESRTLGTLFHSRA
ncbi:MAG: DoxX family protein [Polyangiaceae bacterium]